MRLELSRCVVRSWRLDDAPALTVQGNNWNVWINLRDAFPHPYTLADAHVFLAHAIERRPETFFAVEVDGGVAGGIGFVLQSDVERMSAEIGYWLGESYWGRGIATEALVALTRHAVDTHGLTRIYALPFAWNAASCRVLEKAGYVLEARLRRSAIKDGRIVDQLQYAFVVPGN